MEDLPDVFEPPDGPEGRGSPLPLAAVEPDEPGCRRCGASCRSVYLWQGDLAQFKERDTKKWVEFHEIETFTKEMPDGKVFWGIKLAQPCKHLIETAPNEFGCAVYDRRPYVCRIYTGINPDGPQRGCGFHSGPEARHPRGGAGDRGRPPRALG
ncbi:MAG: YkgJ family cysteine cluster protein [Planctomycetota bacterium]